MANKYTHQQRRDRHERALALFREPEFFSALCEDVAEGATLWDLAKSYDIPYKMLYSWIESDEVRSDEYEMAVAARDANVRDRVVSGILGVANTDIRGIFNEDGNLKGVHELSDEVASTIQSIDVVYDDKGNATRKVKQFDKVKSLELLGRNQKLFTDKIEASGTIKLGDLVHESLKGATDGGQSKKET